MENNHIESIVFPTRSTSIKINHIEPTFFSTRSTSTHNELGIELGQAEEGTSNSDEEATVDMDADESENYISYARLVAKQIIEMGNEANSDAEEIEIDEDSVINNKYHQEIASSQIYKDKKTLKTALNHYPIRKHFQYRVKKSFKRQFLAECFDKNCSWKLRASRNGNTRQFIIRTFEDNHSCDMKIRLKDQCQATSTIIADMIKYKFTNIKTKTTVADVINELKIHGLRVKYNKAWRSIQKGKEKVRGNVVKSYSKIAKYLYLLHHTSPGSFVELKTEEDGKFLFLFVALNASRKGWLHCIPVVIVDGTFLKSTYRGSVMVQEKTWSLSLTVTKA
ncbi:uncharacterized protein LOC133035685 [Cannabis sativa]|uniref:uncharacterized protein LOC133035685 n=1 Tax=Cannabis sativa TaxID=3483 RepID=UPI0029CA92F2|nr:uncharacterized protein LOC133035685 [Cannabis sativa]